MKIPMNLDGIKKFRSKNVFATFKKYIMQKASYAKYCVNKPTKTSEKAYR